MVIDGERRSETWLENVSGYSVGYARGVCQKAKLDWRRVPAAKIVELFDNHRAKVAGAKDKARPRYTINGVTYTAEEAAKRAGVSVGTLRVRAKRKGWEAAIADSLARAGVWLDGTRPGRTPRAIEIDGVRRTYAQWLEMVGYSRAGLHKRSKKLGIDPREVLTQLVRGEREFVLGESFCVRRKQPRCRFLPARAVQRGRDPERKAWFEKLAGEFGYVFESAQDIVTRAGLHWRTSDKDVLRDALRAHVAAVADRRATGRINVTWRGQTRSVAEWAELLKISTKLLYVRASKLGGDYVKAVELYATNPTPKQGRIIRSDDRRLSANRKGNAA